MAEAVALLLDVGPHMDQAPPGSETSLETSLLCIQMILQRKMFAESKDEVALVLFGSDNTANDLASEGGGYEHINVAQPLCKVNWPMLQFVHNDIRPSSASADFMDALVVACDHLMRATTATKKKFESKSIVLFSNLSAPFGDEQAEEIISGLKNSEIDLTVIGPNLDDTSENLNSEDNHGSSGSHTLKEKTPQQRAGELMIKQVLDQLGGECYSFDEAIQALSFFQKKSVKQIMLKYNLETGSMQIPVRMFTKVSEAKTKTLKKVSARDPETNVVIARTYHLNDEDETEVGKDELINAHRYGSTLVPFSDEDSDDMKFIANKCLKVLGFTKTKNVKRHHFMGSSVMCVVAEPNDDTASVALSAMIYGLYELDCVAVVRRVYQNKATPKVGFLTPHIKIGYHCLLYSEVPFAEDLRQYTFGSLPISDQVPDTVKKMKPSEEQLSVMDELIKEMDLCPKDEEGNVDEILKPKLTFNPYRQRLFQCILHRALNGANEPLPELNPLVAESLKIPQDVLVRVEPIQEKMKDLFKLVKVEEEKKAETNGSGEPQMKKPRLNAGIGDSKDEVVKVEANVTEITSVTPVEDFKAMVANPEQFDKACKLLQEKTTDTILISLDKLYKKPIQCLRILREECIRNSRPEIFNDYMKQLKSLVGEKKLKAFWKLVTNEEISLISRSECPASTVTMAMAMTFLEEVDDSEKQKDNFDEFWDDKDDDFLANL